MKEDLSLCKYYLSCLVLFDLMGSTNREIRIEIVLIKQYRNSKTTGPSLRDQAATAVQSSRQYVACTVSSIKQAVHA